MTGDRSEPPQPRAWPRAWASRPFELVSSGERWLLHAPSAPGLRGAPLRAVQALLVAFHGCRRDHVGDRAAVLSFATLLSMLPLFLLAVAALGAFGFSDQTLGAVRVWLVHYFLPDTAEVLAANLDRALDALGAASGAFGLTGLALLLWTGWGLLSALGRTFRRIWGTRGFAWRLPRILGFWMAVVIGPSLVVVSIFLHGLLRQVPGADAVVNRSFSILTGFGAILIAYLLLPEARTRLKAAAIGAAVAALLWEGLKWGFVLYVRNTFLASAVLASLGVIPLLLLWLYLSWIAFIFGAELAFALQEPERALRRSLR